MKPKPLVPDKAIARMLEGAAQLWHEGRFDQYFEMMDRAGRMAPRNHQIPLDVGAAHLLRYQYTEAEESFARALNAAPDKPAVLEMIALQCRNLNRYDWAERYLEQAAAYPGATPDMLTKLAEMHERFRRLDKAKEALDRAQAADAENPLTLLVRSRIERSAGQLEDAERTIRTLLARTDRESWSTRIRGWYELGANLDRQGRFDEAMSAFVSAKAMIRPAAAAAQASQRAVHAKLREAAGSITPEILRTWASESIGQGDKQKLAVICGHPRSGTTLLEQLLDSHAGVVSAEETGIFYDAYLSLRRKVSASVGMLQTLQAGSDELLKNARKWYLQSMSAFVGSSTEDRLLIDKNPSLTGLLPAIARLFPAAKLVVALRDPRDVVLSCFMQPLPLNPTSSFYLSLAETAVEYESLMGFYQAMAPRLPNPRIEVRYEELVKNVENVSRSVLEFLGLSWDARVLKFDEFARQKLVRSPTYAEVARPISSGAIGRWKNYAKYLEPAMEKLHPLIHAMGYE